MAALPPPPMAMTPAIRGGTTSPKHSKKSARPETPVKPSLASPTREKTKIGSPTLTKKSIAATTSSGKSIAPSVFSATSVTSPFAATPPTPIDKSAAILTIKDLFAIGDQIQVLTEGINAVRPGRIRGLGALGVLPIAQKLDSLIQRAKSNAQESDPFSESGSFAVIGVAFQVQDHVKVAIDALVAARKIVGGVLLGSGKLIVRHTVAKLRQSAKDLGEAVSMQLDPFVQPLAPIVLGDIDDQFCRGSAAYR